MKGLSNLVPLFQPDFIDFSTRNKSKSSGYSIKLKAITELRLPLNPIVGPHMII